MGTFALGRFALMISAATALLAGCGGLQAPIGAPGAMPLVAPVAGGRDLLYISGVGYPSYTNIYTYPRGDFVSSLRVSGGAMCSNAAGDVFITTSYGIAEYLHGRATQIGFINAPFGNPYSCSIDPMTGYLAAVVQTETSFGVAVYRREHQHRWHAPRVYTFGEPQNACSYDSAGDLFVAGFTASSGLALAELPKGGSSFETITLDTQVTAQGDIQWDGQYLAIGDFDDTTIHRFAIRGTRGRQIGVLALSRAKYITQFWIQGGALVGADGLNKDVGFWRYPEGGTTVKRLKVSSASGVTVSLARP